MNTVQFVLQNFCPKFYPKNDHFWLCLVKQILLQTYLLIYKQYYIDQASCVAQQILRNVKSPKLDAKVF